MTSRRTSLRNITSSLTTIGLATSRRRRCVLGLFALLVTADANAIDVRYTKFHKDIEVHADGSYIETRELIEKLESERAAHEDGQIKLPYSASLDDFSVIEAYTLKRDGRHLAVPASSIFVQDGLISTTGLTSFQDIKTSVVVFPNLEAGDSIVLRSRMVRKVAMLPGIFTFSEAFPGDVPFDDVRVSITAPESLGLQVQSVDVPMQGPIKEGNRQHWIWTYSRTTIEPTESAALSALQTRPRILASSVRSYTELAKAAHAQFVSKSNVTKAVQALADQITAGAKTPREKALKIHEWVAHNIRYFAIFLNVGGYVPRNADAVISSGFGDCKEHAVLLQALLAAKGIDSSVALLNGEPLYELPPVPVLAAFDHAIIYVPSLNVWLESNTPSIAFGNLAWNEIDKPALLIDLPTPETRTPLEATAHNLLRLESKITVTADGNASGEDNLSASGGDALAYNEIADSLSTTDPVQWTASMLASTGFVGTGATTAVRGSNRGDFHLSVAYDLPGYAPMTDASSVKSAAPMETLGPTMRQWLSRPKQSAYPYVCIPGEYIERLTIEFPPGTVITLPKDTTVAVSHRHYESSYRLQGTNVTVERHYTFAPEKASCAPEERPLARSIEEAVLADLRKEIRYIPQESSPSTPSH